MPLTSPGFPFCFGVQDIVNLGCIVPNSSWDWRVDICVQLMLPIIITTYYCWPFVWAYVLSESTSSQKSSKTSSTIKQVANSSANRFQRE